MLVDTLYKLENDLVLPAELFEEIFIFDSNYSKEDVVYEVLKEFQYKLETLNLTEYEKAMIARAYNSLSEEQQARLIEVFDFLWNEFHTPRHTELEDFYDCGSSWEQEESKLYKIISEILKDIPTNGICNLTYEYDFRKYRTYSMISYAEALSILSNLKYHEECRAELVSKEAVLAEVNRLNKLLNL